MNNLLTLSLTVILCACSATANTASPVNKDENEYRFETRSYLTETCLLSDKRISGADKALGAALAATLIPKALEYVIDKISKNLSEIKKEETTSISNFYLYQYSASKKDIAEGKAVFPSLNSQFACILTVTGNFAIKGEKVAAHGGVMEIGDSEVWEPIDFKNVNSKSLVLDRLNKKDIILKAKAGIYSIHEVKIEYAEDRSALRLENRYLDVRTTLENRKNVGFAYTFKLKGPGTTPNSKVYTTIPISFGKVSNGKVLYGEQFKPKKTGWVSSIPMSTTSLAHFFNNHFRKAVCTTPAQIKCEKSYMPVQLTVTNTQTKEPSKLSKFVGEVLSNSKEKIVESFSEKYFPDEDALNIAVTDADISVKTALVALEKATLDSEKLLATAQLEKACKTLINSGGSHANCR
jgi:hypothetical protein